MNDKNYQRSTAVLLVALSLPIAALADHEIDEIRVVGKQDMREFELAETVDIGPDSAALLRKAPGANVNGNGPLTGIAQYRGMYGSRINVQVNGQTLSAGGPNWMDPPLSYAPAALLESLVIYRGIAPVSAGQETIGGVVDARTWSGDFSSEGAALSGKLRAGSQSVNDARLLSGMIVVASDQHRLKVSAFTESADDAGYGRGDILPTRYERQRYDIGYGFTNGRHTLQFDYGRNETGDSGTPALPMDIQYIDSDLFSLRHDFSSGALKLKSKFYYSEIGHGMSNYALRQAPADGSRWRQNIATGENAGFSVVADINGWTFGVDGHDENHNSDINNPNNPMFFVVNFNDAERRILGAFVEHQHVINDRSSIEAGVRYNHVSMDSDVVNGMPAMMMPPAAALRDNFNSADRSKTNHNIEWVLKAHIEADNGVEWYAGLSRKTRSPSYQERFLWLPLEATAGLADMRTYTGNLDLEPEVAHELEFGFDVRGERLTVAPRAFYRRVDDYIQGTPSDNMNAVMFVNMMNMMNGTSNQPPLEFNNVDAEIYGADVDWQYAIDDRWSLSGVVSYVRGRRTDIHDNLYRISPLNGLVAVNYDTAAWGVSLESHAYAAQDEVSVTNSEQGTSGYSVLNAKAYWQVSSRTKLGLGIDNLTDKQYENHLGGYNRVMGNPTVAVGERLPAYGRNAFLRLDVQW